MIGSLRKKLASGIVLLILGLGVISLVFTDFGTSGVGGLGALGGAGGGEPLAKVNGAPIGETEVSDMVNRAYQGARQQNPTLDMATFIAEGGFDGILQQSIIAEAIRDYADARGLVASDRMIDREIVNIPAFRNFAGQFDQTAFRAALVRERLSEARLRDDIARTLIQRQLLAPIALGMRAPEGVAREYAALLLERRRGIIGAIPAQLLAAGINPSDAQLAQFYQRNQAAFTLPERRVVKYAVIGPDQVARTAAATEAEIAQVYRNSQAAYGPRETRSIQAIVLPTQQAAQAFVARVRGGTSFLDAANQAGFSSEDVTFADQSREQFAAATSAPIADAAFAAAQGALAGPIRSELGFHVVRVDRITAVPGRPLEAVRGDIARAIEQRKRGQAMNALIGRIEEQLAEGASFEETARGAGLAIVVTPPITAQGQTADGAPFQPAPELRAVLASAFEIEAEEPEPVVEQLPNESRFVLLGVEQVEPAAAPPLARIRDRVRTVFIQRAAMQRARQIADAIAARINGGAPAAQAFAQSQPRVPEARRVDMQRLEISRGGQQVPPALLALFSIPERRAQVLPMPANDGWLIVAHEARTPGDVATAPQLIATTRQEFNRTASEEIAQQFARAIELGSEIERNEEAIARTRRQAGGGALVDD